MKILLLGATGRTGKQIIEAAIQKGFDISAIARKPEKIENYQINITPGTPYDYETVEKAIEGCDAVINTLNVSRKSDNPWAALVAPKDLISKSASNTMKAMAKSGIKRFVTLSTIGAGRSWKKIPFILKFIVSISNMRPAFIDHGKQEEILENSNLDYTICRAPILSNEAHEKGAMATSENEKPASPLLSRRACADFFLQIIEKNLYIRETVSLSNRPA